jgi:RNA recognition motif-containing protein
MTVSCNAWQLLKRPEFLGQFGKIHKIVITRGQYNGSPSDSAYVTFLTREAAANAIHALDGLELDGRHLMYVRIARVICAF